MSWAWFEKKIFCRKKCSPSKQKDN